MLRTSTVIVIICLFHLSLAFYIASDGEASKHNSPWSSLKKKLGLTNQKVELLKSQKNQGQTVSLLNYFLKEIPKYIVGKPIDRKYEPNDFMRTYYNILKQIDRSKSTLKTSVNFEFANKPQKTINRRRRKIAVKMISDLPSERIDDLLKMFKEKHGLTNENINEVTGSEDEGDYDEVTVKIPSAIDPDYMYENLYEDEEDLAIPAKSHHNSEYGSFQELILQAGRSQWQRENEETKLHNSASSHFL